MKYPNNSESVLSPGPWAQLVKIRNCPCSDGIVRTAIITGQPDTVWTIPARVSVRGKSVTGFVTCDENGYKFHANLYGKNCDYLPHKFPGE